MRTEPFFTRIKVRWEELREGSYPMTVPAVKHLDTIRFHPAVTYLAGENASGKSTLIEAVAVVSGFNSEGGTKSFSTDGSGTTDHALADAMTLVRGSEREQGGFFLRAESVYVLSNYLRDIEQLGSYGGNLHHVSHGESFIQIFRSRFGNAKNCLFILDEVESALSPQRQLEFLGLMHQHIERGSMFIVSTHSPILMAYPNSRLYWLSNEGIEERHWKETEHFQVYQAWMTHSELMLRSLLGSLGGEQA